MPRTINCGKANAVVTIPLLDGTYALVNKRDACLVRMFAWSRNQRGYVKCQLPGIQRNKVRGKHTAITMHRLILGVHGHPEKMGTAIDHEDGVKWNNTRRNIEVVGQVVNAQRMHQRLFAKRAARRW